VKFVLGAMETLLTTGQISNYANIVALLNILPVAQWVLEDRGYNSD